MLRVHAIVLFCLLLSAPLIAREIDVQPVSANAAAVARLTAQIEPAFSHVETKTGLSDDLGLTLVIVSGARNFADVAARDGVGMNAEGVLGYAMPGRRRVVLNLSGIHDRKLEPIGVLRHEIAHLVMGSSVRVAHPLWFEEGVAQYVESVALNELIENASAMPFGEFKNLEDIEGALRDEARAGAAYSEVREIIRLIADTYGEKAFKKLMRLLEKGEGPFEKAFENATGKSLTEFESVWLEDQSQRGSERTAGFFGRNFWWILLGLTALILPLALVLRRMRGKSQIEHWEDAEKHYPTDPSWSYHDDEPDSFTPEEPDAWKGG